MQFNAVPFSLVFSAVLIRRDEIFLLSEKYYEFLPDLIRPSIVTSVLGPVSGKTEICVPFVRTGPNKLLLASNLSCHKQFRFLC